MSQFRGYRCDTCGKVVEKVEIVSATVRLDGESLSGEYERDYCLDCVQATLPHEVTLRPLRRRVRTKQPAA